MNWFKQLGKIVDLLTAIWLTIRKPMAVRVKFKGGKKHMASSNVFSAPNIDMVPYDVELLDAQGNVIPPSATGVLSLVSQDANAIVVPNSNDPTGATGTIVAAKGFSGAVGGSASYSDPAAVPPISLSGSWSGTFTPDQPASLQVDFGTPAPAAAPAAAPSAAAKAKAPASPQK
jgi:hypothetical protein